MGSVSVPSSAFSGLSDIPLDPHYALKQLFSEDGSEVKVLLGSGTYRDDDDKPWVLPAVQKAEDALHRENDCGRHEYLPIGGSAQLYTAARELLFGRDLLDSSSGSSDSSRLESRIVSMHTVAGTGANNLGARFLADALRPAAVWLSDPGWVNHANIWGLAAAGAAGAAGQAKAAGVVEPMKVRTYPYWNPADNGLDLRGMLAVLEADARPGDVVVLHACAHNPTGIDPTREQWTSIADVCERRGLFPFFDCAYQGFASGDVDRDIWALRHFVARGKLEMAVAQSFSKNMGLYGQRVGTFHLLTASPSAAAKARGHLTRLQRGTISQPPSGGAAVATAILTTPSLYAEWLLNLQEMSSRIRSVRKALYDELVALRTPGSWEHLVNQIGMFSYTGLTPKQVAHLQAEQHVYILKTGRLSVAGLTSGNVKYVAQGIDAAVRKFPSG